MTESHEIALLCARIANEKKAQNIVVVDLRELTDFTDFFVIATVMPRQGKGISSEMKKNIKELGWPVLGMEGESESKWILLDFVDVIVHLFDPDLREYYDIENLWGDAPRCKWEDKC